MIAVLRSLFVAVLSSILVAGCDFSTRDGEPDLMTAVLEVEREGVRVDGNVVTGRLSLSPDARITTFGDGRALVTIFRNQRSEASIVIHSDAEVSFLQRIGDGARATVRVVADTGEYAFETFGNILIFIGTKTGNVSGWLGSRLVLIVHPDGFTETYLQSGSFDLERPERTSLRAGEAGLVDASGNLFIRPISADEDQAIFAFIGGSAWPLPRGGLPGDTRPPEEGTPQTPPEQDPIEPTDTREDEEFLEDGTPLR
ncbi:MAG: hypothetical protein AAF667_12760 [Pseudomonadota bacterium]